MWGLTKTHRKSLLENVNTTYKMTKVERSIYKRK